MTPTSYADEYMEQVKVYFYILKDLKSNIEFSLTVSLWYYHFFISRYMVDKSKVSFYNLLGKHVWLNG